MERPRRLPRLRRLGAGATFVARRAVNPHGLDAEGQVSSAYDLALIARAGMADPQFAAYAAHTRTAGFAVALERVLAEAAGSTVAVMCSESVWWRCHRRLIADVAVLGKGMPVTHLMPDGRPTPHRPSDGAVLIDGVLHWPAR